jgi:predicted metal-dependent hydrolase
MMNAECVDVLVFNLVSDLASGEDVSGNKKQMRDMTTNELNDNGQTEEFLRTIFADIFRQVSRRQDQPEVHVTFYPFVGLNHTIRIRNQRVFVRISDIFRDAPQSVYRALAHILVGKLFRRRPKAEYETLYHQYIHQPQIMQASDLARQQRGRKQLNGAVGKAYDLEKIFAHLNRRYFDNALSSPALSWSTRRTKRILGHHDAVHNAIIISRSLDQESVPSHVVEYVMYHEMLHIKHKPRIANGRRMLHTSAFRSDEKQFAQYDEAIKWLEHSPRRLR